MEKEAATIQNRKRENNEREKKNTIYKRPRNQMHNDLQSMDQSPSIHNWNSKSKVA